MELDETELKSHTIGEITSIVAAIPEVRGILLGAQRDFAGLSPGAVLDGRDIGTVVCPNADVKLFVTASSEERARRRAAEVRAAGKSVVESEILMDILRRDERDRSRSIAPLHPATDAYLLDTTHLTADAALETAIGIVERHKMKFF
jgi:cytidylate kinase